MSYTVADLFAAAATDPELANIVKVLVAKVGAIAAERGLI